MPSVTAYSGRNITFRSDRLVALSGLTKRLSKSMGMKFVAGLWEKTFAFDLLWKIEGHPPTTRPEEYVAPTWSWASTNGKVTTMLSKTTPAIRAGTNKDLDLQIHIEIEEAIVTVGGMSTSDPAALIDGGYITLQGPIKQVSLDDYKFQTDFVLDKQATGYICLLIYSDYDGKWGVHSWWALLLRPAPDLPSDVYERCGVMQEDQELRPWETGNGWEKRRITIV